MAPNRTKGGFYAVRKGRTTGVFATWADCEEQTKGFPDAKFQKFATLDAAEQFVVGALSAEASGSAGLSSTSFDSLNNSKGKKRAFAEIEDESGWDVVYSDGACKGNGKVGSIAGVGVWWGPNDSRNIAERCPGDQTNNRAELIAILRVLETTPIYKKSLLIKTDSQYCINCFRTWIKGWIAKNWRTAQGGPVKNVGIIRCIAKHFEIRSKHGQKVLLQYVKGHSGDVGNDGADAMANQGAYLPIAEDRDWERLERRLSWDFDEIVIGPDEEIAPVEVQGPDSVIKVVDLPTKVRKVTKDPMPAVPKPSAEQPPFPSVTTSSNPLHQTSSKIPSKAENRSMSTTAQSSVSTSTADSSVHQTASAPSDDPPPVTSSQKAQTANHSQWPKSPLKVYYVAPPLVPVQVEEVNLEDYADCVLDDVDLANELSD